MIADYSAEIKIAIFQYVWKRQTDTLIVNTFHHSQRQSKKFGWLIFEVCSHGHTDCHILLTSVSGEIIRKYALFKGPSEPLFF